MVWGLGERCEVMSYGMFRGGSLGYWIGVGVGFGLHGVRLVR